MPHQYQKYACAATLLFLLLFSFPNNSRADDQADKTPNVQSAEAASIEESLPILPEVTVTGTRIAPMTGATIIDREMIESLPARNGTLNEIIRIVPGVQYSETSAHSFTGGEITPPDVSISGGRFYENNFTIDGFSNNSALDPGIDGINNTSSLPGHPQQIFLDPHLINQITVYDSNVPAEFGGFTGGLVDAETLDPVDRFWGNINFRTTSDSWTKFHIADDDKSDFEDSETAAMQPEFSKYDGGFSLNMPIGTDMGLLMSYQRLESEIPLSHHDGKKDQTRLSENYFLKYGYHLSNKTRLYLTGIYAPNKNEYFDTAIESDFTLKNRTHSATTQLEHDFTAGTWDLNFSYSYQKIKRDAPDDRYRWGATDSIDWESGLEGGYGPIDSSQEDYEIKSAFEFQEFNTSDISHQIKLGFEAEHSKQTYDRDNTSYYYTYFSNPNSPYYVQLLNPGELCNGAVACIDGEQYLPLRYVYEEGHSEASYNRYAGFVQDSISVQRLELFPGVRVSYDTFSENTNVAPRLSASFDLLGNRKSILFGGANRYYSENLLTDRLRTALSASGLYETRDAVDAEFITTNDGIYLWEATDLDTPYSDELTVGIIQKVLGGDLKIQYIKRNSKDELARERSETQPDGYRYYRFNNNGKSKHESYQASWQRIWRRHYFEINGTYQETNTSNLLYIDNVDDEDVAETILYNGRVLHYDEIPKSDFNRPSVINAIYSGQLPFFKTRFTNTTKYRHAYYRLNFLGFVDYNGERIRSYEKERNKSALIFDWRFAWDIPIKRTWSALLTLDIYNVFNDKARVARYDDQFEIGRQFWAGVEVNF